MPDPSTQQTLSLPEMLQKIARERATGVLQVRGGNNWKVLEIQAGSITIVSGDPGKRVRIGEVLLARGKMTREALVKALAASRGSGAPLGDVLVQRGHIARQEIQDIVRFQVEEEIYDLFTWQGAECTFVPGSTIADQIGDYPDAANLAIDPQQVFIEAARRIPIWNRIERHISSAYLIFRLTERGAEMLTTATREGKRLLELVQQGFCLDSIVRKTMVGRFTIWKAASDLVAAQAMGPVPAAELQRLAAQWEGEGRLEEAWGAYRRLAEMPGLQSRAADILGHAEALWKQVRAKEQQGLAYGDGAAEKAPAGSRTTILLLAVLAALVMLAVFVPAIKRVIVPPPKGEDFVRTENAAQKCTEEGRFGDALDLWERYLIRHPEDLLAESGVQIARERYEQVVSNEIARARGLRKEKRFAEAIALYEDILRRFARTEQQELVSRERGETETAAYEYRKRLSDEQRRQELALGKKLLEQKDYSKAYSALRNVTEAEEAPSELRIEARELLRQIEDVKVRIKRLIEAAKAKEAVPDYDAALDLYRRCYDLWPGSTWVRTAADRLTYLSGRQQAARRLYEDGVRLHEEGQFTAAHGRLKRAVKQKGFRWAGLAAEKLADLTAQGERSKELRKRAGELTAQGDLDGAFEALRELATKYPHTPAARGLKLTVSIETVPAGAQVVLNNRRLGFAPRTESVEPRAKMVVTLKKPGFEDVTETYKRALDVPGRVLRFHLQKNIAFKYAIGKPVLSGPVVPKPAKDAAVAGRFYVHAGDRLAGFRSDRGKRLWQADIGAPARAGIGPSVLEETVFAVDGDRLRAFSTDGAERFEIALGSPAATSPVAFRLRLAANRAFVVVACENGSMLSLDLVTRARRWGAQLRAPIRLDPVVNEELVFVASPGGLVTALSVLTGRPRWTQTVPGEVAGEFALDQKGKLLAALTSLGEATVFGASDGTVQARVPIQGVRGGGLALSGRSLFVGGSDGRLRAISIDTAREAWREPVALDGSVRGGPVVHGGFVYIGTEKGRFYCIDAASGREEWHLDTKSPIVAPAAAVAAVAGSDMLVFGTKDGDIFGIEAEGARSGPPRAP